MKRLLTSITLLILILCLSVGMFACGEEKTQTENTTENENNIERHSVELTLDNYLDYLEITIGPYSKFSVDGALSFAIYDNASITLEYPELVNGQKTGKTIVDEIKLNKAGHAISSYFEPYKVIKVTGTVNYIM